MSLVDEFLLRRVASPKPRSPRVLYVTDLARPCLRSSYYDIAAPRPYPVETLRVFQAGRLLEEYWVKVLEERPDFDVLATQFPVYHFLNDLEIHGRADILTQHRNGALIVHEVKSTKSIYYVRKEGLPKPQHLDQLNFYMVGLGLRHGQVDYLDKSALLTGSDVVDLTFRVEAEPSRFAALVAKARQLAEAIDDKSLPRASPGWLCDYCLYQEGCGEISPSRARNTLQ